MAQNAIKRIRNRGTCVRRARHFGPLGGHFLISGGDFVGTLIRLRQKRVLLTIKFRQQRGPRAGVGGGFFRDILEI